MILYNAVRLGEAIERYNRRFKEDMHLDFHEIVEMMIDPDNEVDEIINEIEKRIELRKAADRLFLHDRINYEQYNKIIVGL